MGHFLKRRPNMPIKSNKSKHYRKLAQSAWHQWIHLRFRETCAFHFRHDCSGPLECHHTIPKTVRSLRYHPLNGLLLCSHHHKYCTEVSPHAAPLNFLSLFCSLYPALYDFYRSNRWSIGTINYQLQHEILLSSISDLKNKDGQKNTQCEII
jgi:hypothetical protein